MKKLILKTYSNNRDWNGDCDFAIIDLDRAWIQKAVARIERFKKIMAKIHDSTFLRMEYFDYTPQFYPWSDQFDEIEQTEEFIDRAMIIRVIDLEQTKAVRTECTVMCVTENEVGWNAFPKHTLIKVYTPDLRLDQLEKFFKALP